MVKIFGGSKLLKYLCNSGETEGVIFISYCFFFAVEYYRTASDNIDRRFNSEKKKRNPWRVERWYKPNLLEINKLQDRVAFDQENRYGAETVPRRSDFIEW